jgi:hypothetical protein
MWSTCNFNKVEFSGQVFEKYYIKKFHENSSIGNRDFISGGRTDTMKLPLAFSNFAHAPKNEWI